ncbi:hypothetical protein EJ04DRAFT_166579 [Polyplosphaeria fusca]|uniref:L-dopachrome isomerase n=1 Tax=Polyplosphaeria fusca TaxID=682080 RepID=A0A9P4RC28_9PLEO|nr:hypothetical protein EJ04DRAFT_166579 [Polyplosphaeria fusca]
MPHAVNNSTSTIMSRPSRSTSSSSANQFPRAAGATLLVPDTAGDQLSPSRSTFSFDDSPNSFQPFDDARIARPASSNGTKGPDALGQRQHNFSSRRRTQYYEDQFAYKEDSTSSARDRVTKDGPIIAELRTNVIIKDEYTLVTDLSHHLSQRYQRPESSIMITVNHSACLLLGGSFEPTYILTVTALPASVQPTLNKRNAALVQAFMAETIGVPADRGIVKFIPIADDCFAINGNTILGEIERLERQQADESGGNLKRALTKSSRKSGVPKAKSSLQLSRNNSKHATGRSVITPPLPSPGPFDSGVAVDEKSTLGNTVHNMDSINRKSSMKKKSSRQLNEKSGGKPTTGFVPPPIPEDTSTPRIGKRKSFIAMFKR